MKTILVTGGAGFIGSHLCETLLEQGKKVICIDNFVTGKKENIAELFENENFSFIEHDISNPLEISEKVDQIFELASPASPVDFPKIPIEILTTGSIGLKNVLDLAVEKKARILHTSTSEVYGDPLEHPQKETYWGNVNPIGERSCYDEAKRFGEALIMAYKRKKDIDPRIVRIFNTYGPKMRPDDGRVVPTFIKQALANKPITVFGDGKQTRSFCFVKDEVAGLIALMESDYSLPVNIGNPSEITILEFAKKIVELCNSKSQIDFKPLPKDDPVRRKPDISLAKEKLGWEPKVSLEEGLKKTINWFNEKA
jgi:nucleoside-diphosphate-sugar epimerase